MRDLAIVIAVGIGLLLALARFSHGLRVILEWVGGARWSAGAVLAGILSLVTLVLALHAQLGLESRLWTAVWSVAAGLAALAAISLLALRRRP